MSPNKIIAGLIILNIAFFCYYAELGDIKDNHFYANEIELKQKSDLVIEFAEALEESPDLALAEFTKSPSKDLDIIINELVHESQNPQLRQELMKDKANSFVFLRTLYYEDNHENPEKYLLLSLINDLCSQNASEDCASFLLEQSFNDDLEQYIRLDVLKTFINLESVSMEEKLDVFYRFKEANDTSNISDSIKIIEDVLNSSFIE